MGQEPLQALADALHARGCTADLVRHHTGRTTLRAGHPTMPSLLTVAVLWESGRFYWEWGDPIDLPPEDIGVVADRVLYVLGEERV